MWPSPGLLVVVGLSDKGTLDANENSPVALLINCFKNKGGLEIEQDEGGNYLSAKTGGQMKGSGREGSEGRGKLSSTNSGLQRQGSVREGENA